MYNVYFMPPADAYYFFNGKLSNVLNSVNVPYFSAIDPERKNVFAVKKIIGVISVFYLRFGKIGG